MNNIISEVAHERDEQIIKKFCQEGTHMGAHGEPVTGLCREVGIDEVLTQLHLYDAVLNERMKEEQKKFVTLHAQMRVTVHRKDGKSIQSTTKPVEVMIPTDMVDESAPVGVIEIEGMAKTYSKII